MPLGLNKFRMFNNVYQGKKILVTGHTGFKGTWLTTWLLKLGAKVIGVSIDIPTNPSMFETLNIMDKIDHNILDIRDLTAFKKVMLDHQPDFIFHLAAQAIVSKSYIDPINTISTNVIGTANILESLRDYKNKCTVIIITSDKCYDNVEWVWGYKETDPLGGKDIYSGSKGAAELVIKSYYHSFIRESSSIKIAVGRAGNVIGGGDWAKDRIVVDTMNAWIEDKPVKIRSPHSTRPWQHVLEPLSGYLLLGEITSKNKNLNGEAFNFGPNPSDNFSVLELLKGLEKKWGEKNIESRIDILENKETFNEAGLLKLNCDKAHNILKWESNLTFGEALNLIINWYKPYFNNYDGMYELTLSQIEEYEELGVKRKKVWTGNE